MKDEQLIFIVSQPRSGSTLLQRLLSNNDEIGTASETWLLLPYLSILNPNLIKARYNHRAASAAIDEFILDKKGYISELKNFLLNIYKKNIDAPFILDKTPRYYEILNEITLVFPNALIIILIRNPLDVLHSIIATWQFDEIEHLANDHYSDIMIAPKLLSEFYESNKTKKNIKLIFYEDLIKIPKKTLNSIYNYLNIQASIEIKIDDFMLKGKFGDKTGVKKFSKVEKDNTKKWVKLLSNKKWRSFVYGYSKFLKNQNLLIYNRYKIKSNKNSFSFKYFNYYYYYIKDQTKNSYSNMIRFFFRHILNIK